MKKEGRNYLNKSGQVTIFIIIAIVIIGLIVLIYFLLPEIQTSSEFNEQNPQAFMQTCLEEDIENVIDVVSKQGGSFEPEHYILYQGNKVSYLCYTEEYYTTCVVQQPLLKKHIESEIAGEISEEVSDCFNALVKSYRDAGYTADLQPGHTTVELLPKRIVTTMNYVLTISKGETQSYGSFSVVLNNNLYELTSIANSIIEWEATYGDAETTIYMDYYKDLKVEKHKQQDGSTIYILTDRNNDKSFWFASRSVVWPPGFGAEGVSTS